MIPELPETHSQGWIMLHNEEEIKQQDLTDADFGLQIAPDGRVWVCINGIAFLRFKPARQRLLTAVADSGKMDDESVESGD